MQTVEYAKAYHDNGLNVIPIKTDGSKSPPDNFGWKRWQSEKLPWYQSRTWWARPAASGIGIICGVTSGNLEVMDFDDGSCFPLWELAIRMKCGSEFFFSLPRVMTPKGNGCCHIYYRCQDPEHNQVLARTAEKKIRIETRAQGGYVVAPGSPLEVHPTSRPYRLENGSLLTIPVVTEEQRDYMLKVAHYYNKYKPPPKPAPAPATKTVAGKSGDRPGDVYNRSVTWDDVLAPHGWTIIRTRNDVTYWRKPNSDSKGCHASTNYADSDLLIVFSTSAPPFEAENNYNKFAAFALLNHGGDYNAAAKQLSQQGYGSNAGTEYQTLIDNFFNRKEQ